MGDPRLGFQELLTGPVLIIQEREHIVLLVRSIGQYDVSLAILGVDKVTQATPELMDQEVLGVPKDQMAHQAPRRTRWSC